MSRGWIEVRIDTPTDPAEVAGLVDDAAFQGGWYDGARLRLYWPAGRWSPAILDRLRARFVTLTGVQDPSIEVVSLEDRDWNAAWALGVQPVRAGRRIAIRPSWALPPREDGVIDLVIDPKQAFGTGHHATTHLMAERLESAIRGGERVLDVGTGSGILAMIALRLGAASALGIDSDPVAIACAREGATVNGFGSELELRVASLGEARGPDRGGADLILANLDAQTFLSAGRDLLGWLKPGGRLLISGVLEDDREEIARVFGQAGGVLQAVHVRDGWLALEILTAEGREGERMLGRVHQISVSGGGVPKRPVPEARIDADGVAGDRQATPKIHGGPDRAVCLFSLELIQALQAEGHTIDAGSTGENLTLAGIRWEGLAPGDHLRIGGGVVLELTSYSAPCAHNARWFKDGDVRRISHEHRPGWSRLYARVVRAGEVRRGDQVIVEKQ